MPTAHLSLWPRKRLIGAAALLVLAVVPLLPTLRAAFVYDDTTIIRDNVLLRGWGALAHVWGQPYWPSDALTTLGLYRPLHIAMLAIIWNITGGGALWFHLYALLLVIITVFAVSYILRRGVGTMAALVGAAWFATHPLHVEAVASVANTSELLVTMCTALLVRILGRTALPGNVSRDMQRALLVGLLSAAALAAKESGLLSLPLAALTVWGWQRPGARSTPLATFARENARAWSAAFIGIVAVLLARLAVLGAPVSPGSIAAQGLTGLSDGERVVAMMSLWPRIARMLAWPASLSPFYGPTIFPEHADGLALLSGLVMLAIAVIAIELARRGDRRPLVALAWMGLTYFPASNLAAATGQILSDRVAAVLLVIVTLRGAVMSAHYAVAWTSHRALWTRLAEVAPNEHLSYKLLGMDARARGDTARALPLLERAFAMAPADRQIRFELGQVQYATGRYAAAARSLAPLLTDGAARSEREFVALYLDAVGRADGPSSVVRAAAPLMHSESAPVAALFMGIAQEQLGNREGADSAYAAGLRRSAGDSALLVRWMTLHPERAHHH